MVPRCRRHPDARTRSWAACPTTPWNDIVVDGRGNTYVNNIDFDFGGEFAPGHRRPGHARRLGPPGRRRARLPQRHGGDAGQLDPDRRRVVRRGADRVRHRRRRLAVRPPGMGRPGGRGAGRDLPRRRGCGLVRRGARPALRTGRRGRRGAADHQRRPRLLLLRAGRPGPEDPLRHRGSMAGRDDARAAGPGRSCSPRSSDEGGPAFRTTCARRPVSRLVKPAFAPRVQGNVIETTGPIVQILVGAFWRQEVPR